MNWQKLAPWNWFQDEEKESVQSHISPTPASQLQPRSSMLDLHREFDRLFTDMWRNTGWPSQFGNTSGITNHQWLRPSVDIKENEESFEFTLDVPGIEVKDIDLSIQGNNLIISGERKQEINQEKENYHQIERNFGSFRRVLTLPTIADKENIQANFRNGVLSIKINKLHQPQQESQQIEIKTDD